MADVTVKRFEDIEGMQPSKDGVIEVSGSDVLATGGIIRVRGGLGITSFGMNLIRLLPDNDLHPEHNHTEDLPDGQEEVYIVLEGSATLRAGDEEHHLEPGVIARIGPAEKRKLVTGDEPATVLALGATPGRAYQPPGSSR
jgi:quercetin dioxygenase-like cupin family protein